MKLLQRVGEPPKGLDGPERVQSGGNRRQNGPILMLVCKVNLLKNAPVGGFENGAHCWIRTNDPIGVNDVLYH